jgi:hypothetical protein
MREELQLILGVVISVIVLLTLIPFAFYEKVKEWIQT